MPMGHLPHIHFNPHNFLKSHHPIVACPQELCCSFRPYGTLVLVCILGIVAYRSDSRHLFYCQLDEGQWAEVDLQMKRRSIIVLPCVWWLRGLWVFVCLGANFWNSCLETHDFLDAREAHLDAQTVEKGWATKSWKVTLLRTQSSFRWDCLELQTNSIGSTSSCAFAV